MVWFLIFRKERGGKVRADPFGEKRKGRQNEGLFHREREREP